VRSERPRVNFSSVRVCEVDGTIVLDNDQDAWEREENESKKGQIEPDEARCMNTCAGVNVT
jgi:hypothetical protein